jgi:exoribonuclease-2
MISGFDAAYSAYNGFQHGIERYWTLRWLEQNGSPSSTPRHEGRPGARRHAAAGVPGRRRREPAARRPGAVSGSVTARLDDPTRSDDDAVLGDEGEDAEESAAPLALAIDVSDADAEVTPTPSAAAGG